KRPATLSVSPVFRSLKLGCWLEAVAVFGRIHEAAHHFAEVCRVRVQVSEPSVEAGRFWIAPQVADVLHEDESRIVLMLILFIALDDGAQSCGTARIGVARRSQVADDLCAIGERDAGSLRDIIYEGGGRQAARKGG